MNLSSSNNGAVNSHPITPVSQGPPSDPLSASFQHCRSSLVDLYYAQNCLGAFCSSSQEESEEPPEVPPLPSALSLEQTSSVNSPTYYKSLDSTPIESPKSTLINLGNYFPKITTMPTDSPNRKLYQTASREKQKVNQKT